MAPRQITRLDPYNSLDRCLRYVCIHIEAVTVSDGVVGEEAANPFSVGLDLSV